MVADLEAARAALGYQRVNLLGESYGTRVAQIYGHLHPERIHRSVMIGVNPPGRFVWEPQTIDAQLRYYARLCDEDHSCRARTSDLAEAVAKVARQMPNSWLKVRIDPGKVRLVSFVLLFNRATAAMVFDAYLAAASGDPSGLALMSLASDFVLPRQFTWGDFFAKGASADLDPSRDYASELDPADSILGSPLSLIVFDGLSGNWPAHQIPAELRRAERSDVETLLVCGSVDFSTPAEFAANELPPSLTNRKHVIVAEAGHVSDIWDLQPHAAERLLTSFYDTEIADDSLYTYSPMDFVPSLRVPGPGQIHLAIPAGLPRLAKAIPAVGAMFVIGAAGAWRAIRHRLRA